MSLVRCPSQEIFLNKVDSSMKADATAPQIYNKAFQTVDPTFSGEVSVNALSRVLATSALPATTVDRVCF